ncbi:MAG TPA: lipid kinase [Pasteurellaceae bacterium]|nr:lipid kinase [Pasteurellaceae bacterium]
MKNFVFILLFFSFSSLAKDTFKVCWSIYAGWMPWSYAAEQGIIKKWADKYDIAIDVVQVNEYMESINQYTSGAFDGCTLASMDALTIPAAGGVDTTALILGDYSNGNDAVIMKGSDSLADIKGANVNLVELSLSHYLLARGLNSVGLSEDDVQIINTSDADIVSIYNTNNVKALVTWNPMVNEIMKLPESHIVFDSSQIPGEIMDLMVVNTETLKQHPALGKALVGAWYETMQIMASDSEQGKMARSIMAQAAGTDLASYENQLATTKMFYQAKEALDFMNDPRLITTMKNVAEFSFKHGLLGEGANDAGAIGIETPQGTYGNKENIKLRFNPIYTQMAADGNL